MKSSFAAIGALAVGATALVLHQARGGPVPARPNILLISVDTLRRDHLGCYGYARATPNIDALARGGARFTNFNSTSNWTLPAHGAMFTGRYAAYHGLRDEGVKLAPSIPTLAEHLKKAGYWTMGVVSHVYVSSEFGLEKGFDVFDDSLIEKGATNPIAEKTVDRFLDRLQAANPQTRPFFAFLHLFDPHWDYTAPPPYDKQFTDPAYRGPIDGTTATFAQYWGPDQVMPIEDRQHLINLYDGELAYVDAQIGRLLDALRRRGLLKNTIIVLTSDHGEEFEEHRRLGHARTMYVEVLGIPLIISGHPAYPAGVVRGELTSMIDLAPTLLELAVADPMPGTQGESLVRPVPRPGRLIYGGSIRWGTEVLAVMNEDYKLIHWLEQDAYELYDLKNDPLEQHRLTLELSGNPLVAALDDFSEIANAGWHLKLISLDPQDVIRCYGSVRTQGRLVNPRRLISDQSNKNAVVIHQFDLAPGGQELNFDIEMHTMMGRVSFEVDPPQAPVEFALGISSMSQKAGIFVGPATRLADGERVVLQRNDPRMSEEFGSFTDKLGCYITSVAPQEGEEPRSQLTPEAMARLRSLGYLGGTPRQTTPESNPSAGKTTPN